MTLLLTRRRQRRSHPSTAPRSYALLCDCTADSLCDACALPTASPLDATATSSGASSS